MEADKLKGVGGGQPTPIDPTLGKKGNPLLDAINDYIRTESKDSAKTDQVRSTTRGDTSSQSVQGDQTTLKRSPPLSRPSGGGGIPGGPTGAGNPWLEPSKSALLINMLLKVMLSSAGNKLKQALMGADQMLRSGELALKHGEAVMEEHNVQADQQRMQAISNFVKAGISLTTAAYSTYSVFGKLGSTQDLAKRQYASDLDKMKSNTTTKVDDYLGTKDKLAATEKDLRTLQSSDPPVNAAKTKLDADKKSLADTETKLIDNQTKLYDLKQQQQTLQTEQKTASSNLTKVEADRAAVYAIRPPVTPDEKTQADSKVNVATAELSQANAKVGKNLDDQKDLETKILAQTDDITDLKTQLATSQKAYDKEVDASSNRDFIKGMENQIKEYKSVVDDKKPGLGQCEDRVKELQKDIDDYKAANKGAVLTVKDPVTGATTTKATSPQLIAMEDKLKAAETLRDTRAKEVKNFEDNADKEIGSREAKFNKAFQGYSEVLKSTSEGIFGFLQAGLEVKKGQAKMAQVLYQNMMQQIEKLSSASQLLVQSFGEQMSSLIQSIQGISQTAKQLGTYYNAR